MGFFMDKRERTSIGGSAMFIEWLLNPEGATPIKIPLEG